jgi:hypothetical protein
MRSRVKPVKPSHALPLLVLAASCSSAPRPPIRTAAPPLAPRSKTPVAPKAAEAPAYIYDDFAAARALSAQKNLPLFVELEAPW